MTWHNNVLWLACSRLVMSCRSPPPAMVPVGCRWALVANNNSRRGCQAERVEPGCGVYVSAIGCCTTSASPGETDDEGAPLNPAPRL